jgi:hypothetical protein
MHSIVGNSSISVCPQFGQVISDVSETPVFSSVFNSEVLGSEPEHDVKTIARIKNNIAVDFGWVIFMMISYI